MTLPGLRDEAQQSVSSFAWSSPNDYIIDAGFNSSAGFGRCNPYQSQNGFYGQLAYGLPVAYHQPRFEGKPVMEYGQAFGQQSQGSHFQSFASLFDSYHGHQAQQYTGNLNSGNDVKNTIVYSDNPTDKISCASSTPPAPNSGAPVVKEGYGMIEAGQVGLDDHVIDFASCYQQRRDQQRSTTSNSADGESMPTSPLPRSPFPAGMTGASDGSPDAAGQNHHQLHHQVTFPYPYPDPRHLLLHHNPPSHHHHHQFHQQSFSYFHGQENPVPAGTVMISVRESPTDGHDHNAVDRHEDDDDDDDDDEDEDDDEAAEEFEKVREFNRTLKMAVGNGDSKASSSSSLSSSFSADELFKDVAQHLLHERRLRQQEHQQQQQ